MRLQIVQDALKKKNIKYEYTEIDGCGSLDFLFRGLKFHVWEYEDRVWGAETNIYEAGRSQDIEGNYEEVIAREILSWPCLLYTSPRNFGRRGATEKWPQRIGSSNCLAKTQVYACLLYTSRCV